MAESSITDVADKLDTLIRLQALGLVSRFESQKEKILFLNKAGLAPKLIGEVLGISANQASVAISQAKKASDAKLAKDKK
jgi:DNA-directed RNA polymerase specialized sigma24 family protein